MKKLILTLGLMFGLIFAGTSLSAQAVVVKVRPPAPKKVVVVKTKKPRKNHVYVSGHWKWNPRRNKYVWVNGYYVKKRPNQVYVSGHWRKVRGGYTWVPGRWKYV